MEVDGDNSEAGAVRQRAESLVQRGIAWVHLGLLSMALATPSTIIDPTSSLVLQHTDLREQIWELDTESAIKRVQGAVLFGATGEPSTLTSSSAAAGALVVQAANVDNRNKALALAGDAAAPSSTGQDGGNRGSKRDALLASARGIAEQVVLRPEHSQYADLVSEIARLNDSLCSSRRVMEVAEGLQRAVAEVGDTESTAATSARIDSLLQQEALLQSNQEEFCAMLERKFPLYRDIVQPLVIATQHVRCGLRLLAFADRKSS